MTRRLDMTIGQRLALGFGTAGALLLALVLVTHLAGRQVADARERQLSLIAPREEAARSLERSALYLAVAARSHALEPDERRRQEHEAALAGLREALGRLTDAPRDPDGAALVAPLPGLVEAYEQATRAMVAAAATGEEVRAREQAMSAARERLLQPVRRYSELQHGKLAASRRDVDAAVGRMQQAVIGVGGLLLALAALSGLLTARSVRRPALALVRESRRLASGDYGNAAAMAAAAPKRDELAVLEASFGKMGLELAAREQKLLDQNAELQAQYEEIQAQGEELQSQNEELQAQTEELQAQGDELQHTIDRLVASEGRYHALFTNLSEGFALHEMMLDEAGRPLDYRFLAVNPAFERLTGLPAERLLGRTVREAIPGIEPEWIERYGEVVRTGVPAHFDSFAAALGRHYHVAAFAIGKEQFATLALDITEQKRAEESLRSADRNKNEFLALLSHELRNPLAPIRNSLHVLARVPPGSAQAQRALAVIERQVGQLSSIVEDLLDVTRISRGKIQLRREPVDLVRLVRQGVDDAHSSLGSNGLALVVDIPDEPLCVEGDPVRLAQVLGNLLQNAAKFTPRGGSVSVALRREGERAALRVRDSGVGMERRTLEQLFQPFVQADVGLARTNAGLGLGLALVRSLVEMHGGSVTATSDGRGKGSEFLVTLPLANVAVQPPGPSAAAERPSARRVLVIEDNADAGDSLREVLALGGHEVEIARAGAEGLERAKAMRPDLVLCDIGLPDLSGHEVAAAFRSDPQLRSVRLVALSGYALPDDVARAAAAGFDDHLAKPPSIERLHQILASLAGSGNGSAGDGSLEGDAPGKGWPGA